MCVCVCGGGGGGWQSQEFGGGGSYGERGVVRVCHRESGEKGWWCCITQQARKPIEGGRGTGKRVVVLYDAAEQAVSRR